jgi:hypothetical protein
MFFLDKPTHTKQNTIVYPGIQVSPLKNCPFIFAHPTHLTVENHLTFQAINLPMIPMIVN